MRLLPNSCCLRCAFFVLILSASGVQGQTSPSNPLAAADTSSPRAVLRSFMLAIDEGLAHELKSTLSYLASNRLYPNDFEQSLSTRSDESFGRALEVLDYSGLPSGFRGVLAVEHVVLLSEILARLEMPPFEAIPDHEALRAQGETRWMIPNTRIEITRIEGGPRHGEYLFSARTVSRLGEYYQRVADLAYRSGSVQRFVDGISPYTSSRTLYDIYRNSTTVIGVIPGRWLLKMPSWLTSQIGTVALFKWLALAAYTLLMFALITLLRTFCGRSETRRQWCGFLTTSVVAVFTGGAIWLFGKLHISGEVLYVLGVTTVSALYITLAWTAFLGGGAVAEMIIGFQQMRTGAMDSQLIRLGARLIGLLIAVAFLVEGADELGFPAYSVLTGLGIGGLAVALAARETLANLLGSIVIMFEKPFRGGHWIKVGDAEGTVEHVGFRSTRIRTFADSLISIPNSTLVNTVVDNLGMRGRRRQQFIVQVTYDTPRDKLAALVDGIRRLIADHPMTDREVAYTHLYDLTESGLGILVYFHLRVPDYASELKEREVILKEIMGLAEALDVRFAYPTRTVQLETSSKSDFTPSHEPG